MKRIACALAAGAITGAAAWGPDGHAIVAELAQRHLGSNAQAEVARLLGPGTSLASVSNWADDVRNQRPESFNWHFVDIPLEARAYDAERDCAPTRKGDCILGAIARERRKLACSRDPLVRRDALRFIVHFIADLHQPFHTIAEKQGGNRVSVTLDVHAATCARSQSRRGKENLHALWDTVLVSLAAWNWGAYVTRLAEAGLPKEAMTADPEDWALEAHRIAADIWTWLPDDHLIGDDYYRRAVPVLDRQLSRAAVRLAMVLDQALDPAQRDKPPCRPGE
jgi:hypothetical protein